MPKNFWAPKTSFWAPENSCKSPVWFFCCWLFSNFFSWRIIVRSHARKKVALSHLCQRVICGTTLRLTRPKRISFVQSQAATSLTVGSSDWRCIWKNTMECVTLFAHLKTAEKPSTRKEISKRISGCTLVKSRTTVLQRTVKNRLRRKDT